MTGGNDLLAAASAGFVAALAAAALLAAATSALIVLRSDPFAPGGLEAMTTMAFALGLDPLFVGAHHLARFLPISLTLPFAASVVKESQDHGQ